MASEASTPILSVCFFFILNWIIMAPQKLLPRYRSFLRLIAELISSSSTAVKDEKISNITSSPILQSRSEDVLCLMSRGEVEAIMGGMGLGTCKESEQLRSCMGTHELSALFEEEEPSLEEVGRAFAVFDENGDGFIDAAELQRVLRVLGLEEGAGLGACRAMVAAHDKNGDGKIDAEEFVGLLEIGLCRS